jgi:hypothetical protein
MKGERASTIMFLTEASTSLTVFALSYHCFTQNNLYPRLLRVLELLQLPQQLTPLIPPSILLSVALALTLTGAFTKICHLSLVLLLPSTLWFSNLDWLQILNLPINLQLFKTEMPLTYILGTGVLLFSTETLLHFLQHAKRTRSELLSRGADRWDVEKTAVKQYMFALTLTTLSTLTAVATAAAALLLKAALLNLTAQMPYPYIILGTSAAAITLTSILAYLKAHSKTSQ